MNIRKFTAPTARQALKDIRNELGEEAVILSNRNIEGGVEIIALANDDQLSGIMNQESGAGRGSTPPRRQAQDGHAGLKPDLPAIAPQSSILNPESSILVAVKSLHNMLGPQRSALFVD